MLKLLPRFLSIRHHPVWTAALLLIVLLVIPVTPSSAQLNKLDDNQFIDGLRQQGMSELLLHFVETSDNLAPTTESLIQIAQLRLRATRLLDEAAQQAAQGQSDDAQASRAQAVADWLEAFKTLEALCRDHLDNPSAPIWLTDLAAMALTEYLPRFQTLGAAFVEFGVPTEAQRDAFALVIPTAYRACAAAETSLFNIYNRIGADPALVQALEESGLRFRLDAIQESELPFYGGHTAYYMTILPDDHPYFQSARQGQDDPWVMGRETSVSDERERLLDQAFGWSERFVESGPSSGRRAAKSLMGRILTAQGQAEQALVELDDVFEPDGGGWLSLLAGLGRARALEAIGEPRDAEEQLLDLERHPASLADPSLFRLLLIVDANHNLLLRQAGNNADAIAQAYALPYGELFNNPDLGAQLDMIRGYIHGRWADGLAGQGNHEALPPMVRVGVASHLLARAQTETAQGGPALDSLLEAAAFVQGIENTDADDELIGEGLYARGVATLQGYGLAAQAGRADEVGGTQAVIDAVDALVQLAQDQPGHPKAESAIALAIGPLLQIHQTAAAPAAWKQRYLDAGELLLTEFANTDAADGQRVYHTFHRYQQAGQFLEAAERYNEQSGEHPSFFEAQRLAIFCMEQALKQAQSEGDDAGIARATEALLDQAESTMAITEGVLATGEPDRRSGALKTQAVAVLAQSLVAEARGEVDRALELLTDFDGRYPEGPVQSRRAAKQRLLILVRQQQLEPIRKEATELIERYQADAVPVVQEVLASLDEEIAALDLLAQERASQGVTNEAEAAAARAKAYGDTAVALAQGLLNWARTHDAGPNRMARYQRSLAKAYLVSGRLEDADDVTKQLMLLEPNNLDTIVMRAETLYRRGTAEGSPNTARLTEAAKLLDKVIVYYRDRDDAATATPHWFAWTHRLLIMDALGDSGRIAPSIRRLKQKFPNLGGPPWNNRINAIFAKNT